MDVNILRNSIWIPLEPVCVCVSATRSIHDICNVPYFDFIYKKFFLHLGQISLYFFSHDLIVPIPTKLYYHFLRLDTSNWIAFWGKIDRIITCHVQNILCAQFNTIYTKYYSSNSKLLSKLQIEEIEQEIKSSGSQFGLYF